MEKNTNSTSINSAELYHQACQVIPGGVNSPVRACKAVGTTPRFVKRGRGSFIFDEEGRKYFDLVNSWGPLIFGHNPPSVTKALEETLKNGTTFGAPTVNETKLASLIIKHIPSIEMVRLVNSGTEAAMSAIRLARGFTNRDKIIKFEGCYHGHADSLLVAAGSGLATFSLPGSLGVPKAIAELTVTCPYNDLKHLTEIFKSIGSEVAAVIVEPIAGNMGLVLPVGGFLEGIQKLCRQYGALFICDEVITGFRLSLDGAQGLFGLEPDLTILGKVIGGGLPLAAFGGRREIMELLAPLGGVYQAGTLSGNPLAVAAGIAAIEMLESDPSIYKRLEYMAGLFACGLAEVAKEKKKIIGVHQIGSMLTLFFHPGPIINFKDVQKCDTRLYSAWYRNMLDQGVWLPPSQFECIFFSGGFSFGDMPELLQRVYEAFSLL
jgi:glutamate-1-semialdehyde 2,1-aminomutase